MNDKERDKAFKKERSQRIKDRASIQRATHAEIMQLLQVAQDDIQTTLRHSPTEWEAWYLPQVQQTITTAMTTFSTGASAALGQAAGKAWQAGLDLIDKPIAAGGISIEAMLPSIDTKQLAAMRTFMTDRMTDIGATVAAKINGQMGLVVIGTQSTGDAISQVANIIDQGGRSRATTIVRTELGRVYSTAAHERQQQAKKYLPGMKKQWRRSGKIHSRLAHDAADGQIQPVDDPFIVGGVALMYPHDPKAPAAHTINCGCISLPFMDDWTVESPKKKPFTDLELANSPLKKALNDSYKLPPAPLAVEPTPKEKDSFAELLKAEPKRRKARLFGTPERREVFSKGTGASETEAAALMDYTDWGYFDVNDALRTGKTATRRFSESELAGYIDAMSGAIDRLPRSPHEKLTRILGDMTVATRSQVVDAYEHIGQTVTYNEFLSTSAPGGAFKGLANVQVMLEIKAIPASSRAGYVGRYAVEDEKEVLYKNGTRFKVLDIRTLKNDVIKIVLEELA